MVEERIVRVETTLDKHSTQINKLFSRIEDTNEAIQKINNSMLQIKWSVYGAIGFYIITQIGIIEAFKVEPMDSYGAADAGQIAWHCSERNYHINIDIIFSYWLEDICCYTRFIFNSNDRNFGIAF